MDDRMHRESGRQTGDQYRNTQGQWLMQPQPSMKQIMAIMAERDAAIHERNMAVAEKKEAIGERNMAVAEKKAAVAERDMAVAEKKAAVAERDMAVAEKKAAVAERDMALLHRDSAIAERNIAIRERDNAMTTLQSRENSLANANMSSYPPGFQISRGMKHVHHQQQHSHHLPHMSETSFDTKEMHGNDSIFISQVSPEALKPQQGKRDKDVDKVIKKATKPTKKVKRASKDLNKAMFGKSNELKNGQDKGGSDDTNKQLDGSKFDWKGHDLGLNQVAFDETTMPSPVCSCTGIYRQCYKWGNCGWQSACCTTTTSCYPLPAVPDKPKKRVGGRKMSGSAFSKLLNRLAAEGHDLSNPVDLKEHWAKHGTNRYITIK